MRKKMREEALAILAVEGVQLSDNFKFIEDSPHYPIIIEDGPISYFFLKNWLGTLYSDGWSKECAACEN